MSNNPTNITVLWHCPEHGEDDRPNCCPCAYFEGRRAERDNAERRIVEWLRECLATGAYGPDQYGVTCAEGAIHGLIEGIERGEHRG